MFHPDEPRDFHGRWSGSGGGDGPHLKIKGSDVKVGDHVLLPEHDPESYEPIGHRSYEVTKVERDRIGVQIVVKDPDGQGHQRKTLDPAETYTVKRPGAEARSAMSETEITETEQRSKQLEAKLDAGLPEYRSVPFLDFEAKNDGWSFEGLAAVYGEEADLGDFTEEFRHGSFRKPLASGDNTRLIYDHSPPHVPVLATIAGKTLTLKDDVKGLIVRGDLAQHYVGAAARELINRGDIKGMSPGMVVGQGNSEITYRGGKLHRAIRSLKHLREVSLTPDPVYAGTTAELRSLLAFRMVDSLEATQQALMGVYPQLESRATPPADTEEETKAEVCETCGTTPCECTVEVEEEQRSGADAFDKRAAAARRRRLTVMSIGIPEEFRAGS